MFMGPSATFPAIMSDMHLLWPKGFRASGVYGGIKSRPVPDVGMLVCDESAAAAVLFTANRVVAAPITIGRRHAAGGRLRGVVVNSGNANACTGKQGEKDALRMCQAAAESIGGNAKLILPSSTGIIGHVLPMGKIVPAIAAAAHSLGSSAEHSRLFADAILTTDTCRKTAEARFTIARQEVRLAGVCKGSGMIGPRLALGARHATMLAYLTTDAQASPPVLRKLLAAAAEESFNAVTVDDHASTNDTLCLLASGLGGGKITTPAAVKSFAAALKEVCQSLARQIAADGEGATKLVIIRVKGAATTAGAKAMARAIAVSPLVKCAMNGNDPNWGRIVSAAGMAGAPFDPDRCVLTLAGSVVFHRGRPAEFDADAVSAAMNRPEVTVDLDCRSGSGAATVWTCDLSKEYVTINADYHT
jgi:glutamate N-acetyltransferase / amino-acid N-acetyltransferase